MNRPQKDIQREVANGAIYLLDEMDPRMLIQTRCVDALVMWQQAIQRGLRAAKTGVLAAPGDVPVAPPADRKKPDDTEGGTCD